MASRTSGKRARPTGVVPAVASHGRAGPVVPPLRSALGPERPTLGGASSGSPPSPRYRPPRPGTSGGPPRGRPRGRFPGLPDPPGVSRMVGRTGGASPDGILRASSPYRAGLAGPAGERLAQVDPEGGTPLRRRPGALPRVLTAALASPGGTCYRHCGGPIRTRRIPSRLPGTWLVRACPSGVVSVTTYAEWTRRDPTRAVRSMLRRWTLPKTLVRSRDLRLATRHGPELGQAVERWLAAARPARGVRVVYWRVYPFRGRGGDERRLFVCFRRTHPAPVFFASPTNAKTWGCPVCGRRRKDRAGRGG